MNAPSRTTLSTLALWLLLGAGSASLHAQGSAPRPLAHCNWGDFGCTNPPPAAGAGLAQAKRAAPQTSARLACDPVLSSPGECWTNCKTEEEITICDIVQAPGKPGR